MQMWSNKRNKQEEDACRGGVAEMERQMWVTLVDTSRGEDNWFMGWIMGWQLSPFSDIQIQTDKEWEEGEERMKKELPQGSQYCQSKGFHSSGAIWDAF